MSTLLYALGRWSYRHPWRVLVAWLLLLGIAGGSAAVFMKGTDNAFSIPGTEAQAGIEQLEPVLPAGERNQRADRGRRRRGRRCRDEPYSSAIEDTIAADRGPRRGPRRDRSVQRDGDGARVGRRLRRHHPPAVRRAGDRCAGRDEDRAEGDQRRLRGVPSRRVAGGWSAATCSRSRSRRSRSSRPSASWSRCSC